MSSTARPPEGAADRWLGASVFLLLLALYAATLTTQPDLLDGEVEFQTTSSLVRRGTLALGGTPEAEAIAAYHDGRGFDVRRGGPGREHETFSWFGVGQAYVGVPFYLVGALLHRAFPALEARAAEVPHLGVHRSEYLEHLLVGLRNPLLGALTAWLLFRCARRLGAGPRSAWLASLGYGCASFAWPQARSTLNTVQAAFFLCAAFALVLEVRERLARGRTSSRALLAACGAALGGAFLTRSLCAPALPVLGAALLAVLWSAHRRTHTRARIPLDPRELAWFAAPALLCLGLFLWTNELRFGDPLEQGYGGVVTWDGYFNYPLLDGLAGLAASPGKGLVWMAPASMLTPLWLALLWRGGERALAVLVVLLVAALLVPVALTAGWHGGWGYGPRYALPALPFLWLGVAPALDVLGRRAAGKVLAGLLLAAGFLVAFVGAAVDSTTHTELAIEAARLEWPEVPGVTEDDREAERFQRIVTDLRFAAPLVHWRLLVHRLAGHGETFPVRTLFHLERDEVLTLPEDRDHGFRHLAWVDLEQRVGGSFLPVALLLAACAGAGALLARRGWRALAVTRLRV